MSKVNTEALIPGEYYWVKYTGKTEKWQAMVCQREPFSKHLYLGFWQATAVFEIYCDPEGNPIPIKRPE